MVTNDTNDVAKNIIEQEINAVLMTLTRVKENGCVACHFTLVDRMKISEAEGSDRLTYSRSEFKRIYRYNRKDTYETKNDGCNILAQKS